MDNFSGAATPRLRPRPRLENRIVGGGPVDIEDYPYQVKMWLFTSKKNFFNSTLFKLISAHLPNNRCFIPVKRLINNIFRCRFCTWVYSDVAVQSSVRTGFWRLLIVVKGKLMLPVLKGWKSRLCAIQQNTQWGGNINRVKYILYIEVILTA